MGEASDGGEAVERARELRPDVVLMDVRMPGIDGIEATRRLLRDGDAPRILMLTTFDLDEYVYEAMKAGASGFLLKDVPRDQLVGAVRTVAAGDALLAPALVRRLIEDFVRRPAPGARVAGRARRADRARARGAHADRARSGERRDRELPLRLATRRCAPTSRTSSRSSDCAIASRRSCSRTKRASSSRAADSRPVADRPVGGVGMLIRRPGGRAVSSTTLESRREKSPRASPAEPTRPKRPGLPASSQRFERGQSVGVSARGFLAASTAQPPRTRS